MDPSSAKFGTKMQVITRENWRTGVSGLTRSKKGRIGCCRVGQDTASSQPSTFRSGSPKTYMSRVSLPSKPRNRRPGINNNWILPRNLVAAHPQRRVLDAGRYVFYLLAPLPSSLRCRPSSDAPWSARHQRKLLSRWTIRREGRRCGPHAYPPIHGSAGTPRSASHRAPVDAGCSKARHGRHIRWSASLDSCIQF